MGDAKKIVCIEDEPDMIGLVEAILGSRGFDVIGALGGRVGLETMRRVKPDLVLLDLMMPDMDGQEVYRQMQADADLKDIPVIIITAQAQSIDQTLWRHVIKVEDYIVKPFNTQILVESVSKVLAKRSP